MATATAVRTFANKKIWLVAFDGQTTGIEDTVTLTHGFSGITTANCNTAMVSHARYIDATVYGQRVISLTHSATTVVVRGDGARSAYVTVEKLHSATR